MHRMGIPVQALIETELYGYWITLYPQFFSNRRIAKTLTPAAKYRFRLKPQHPTRTEI